jgi:molybdenum cofactor biosynthesis protein B
MSQEPTSASSQQHREIAAERIQVVDIAVVTVSDTRTPETDVNAHYLREAIAASGNRWAGYRLIKDEPKEVEAALDDLVSGPARLVLFNGGTGIAPRDTTFDVLSGKIEKQMPGFGELFRMLSWEQIGAGAMLSRALAGISRGKLIFSMPGSPKAVDLAMTRLILPELKHLLHELRK